MSRADRHSRVDQNCVKLVLMWHLLIRAVSINFQLFRVLDVVTEFCAHHGETLQTNGKNIRCTMHCKLLLRIGHLTALFTLVFVTLIKPLFPSKLLKTVVQIFAPLKSHYFLSNFSCHLDFQRHIEKGLVRIRIMSARHASDSGAEPTTEDSMWNSSSLFILVQFALEVLFKHW